MRKKNESKVASQETSKWVSLAPFCKEGKAYEADRAPKQLAVVVFLNSLNLQLVRARFGHPLSFCDLSHSSKSHSSNRGRQKLEILQWSVKKWLWKTMLPNKLMMRYTVQDFNSDRFSPLLHKASGTSHSK